MRKQKSYHDLIPPKLVSKPLLDSLGRKITDIRISLTDRCNFRCTYCMPKEVFHENYKFLSNKNLLSFNEIYAICSSFITLGVEKIRLTGGEPLLRKNIENLIKKLVHLKTLSNQPIEIALTTNGTLLQKKSHLLYEAGLRNITVSLDSINQDIFRKISNTEITVKKILDGIDSAKKSGLKVKVNMVVKKGVNDDQILPMAEYFKAKSITLRFIEFMDVGSTNEWLPEKVVTSNSIKNLLNDNFGLEYLGREKANEVSEYWTYKNSKTKVGLISSVSKPFCSNCSRARISADGFMFTCLFSTFGTDLKQVLRSPNILKSAGHSFNIENVDELTQLVKKVWESREDQYSNLRLSSPKRINEQKIEMSYIGG